MNILSKSQNWNIRRLREMDNQALNSNQIVMVGVIVGDLVFSHEMHRECFYSFKIAVKRKSGKVDYVPCMVSERVCNLNELVKGAVVKLQGQFRSFNQYSDGRRHLKLDAFAMDIDVSDEYEGKDQNEIYLEGYICRKPVLRKTLCGWRVADILVAVNRANGKSDYIPCIAWGRNAKYAAGMEVGTKIRIHGRVQSREYEKKVGGETEIGVAYEVSARDIEEER